MPRWWHDEPGRAWLEELPGLVAARLREWGLTADGAPWHGSNALVLPVRRGEEPLALRLSPPGDDVAAEAAALLWWDGRGTVLLVEADVPARALLLERLDGSHTLRREPVEWSVEVLATLMRELAVPAPGTALSTAEIAAEDAASFERRWQAVGGPTPRSQLTRAVAAARELAATDPGGDAVDGDLHADQVLRGRRTPWLVVDPVLLRGDREHDLARVLWTRLDELPRDADVRRAVATAVTVAEVPRERAEAWLVVRSMSYLLWGLERGLTEDPVRCRRLLDLFAR
ncbi:kinase [Auraticoccus sp. F435]|uniref:Kinase n=2 Tax=Auraticoccus cholistanensis TaxID=2656650 RepID=A0A6A9V127_9ACTN|nr:aminoglycoside phosphotransferase family protein [Auraticoccus cholistanensis]MVA76370.1 kinase [Auraticoccus cholistanensis]